MAGGLERRVGLGIGMDKTSGTVRLVKVGRITQVRRDGRRAVVPYIRLSGRWLARAGVLEGDRILVTAANGKITMVRQNEQGVPGREQGGLF